MSGAVISMAPERPLRARPLPPNPWFSSRDQLGVISGVSERPELAEIEAAQRIAHQLRATGPRMGKPPFRTAQAERCRRWSHGRVAPGRLR